MESQIVRKRVNIIAGHLAATSEDISATATHVFPMSCSNSLNSVIRRYDNRMFFARQGSGVQACFMKEGSSELSGPSGSNSPNSAVSAIRRCDNMLFFSRQGSDDQAYFMRQGSSKPGSHSPSAMPLKSPYSANKDCCNPSEAPSFSKPTEVKPSTQEGQLRSLAQSCRYNEAVHEAPMYARPDRVGGAYFGFNKESTPARGSNDHAGSKWSPRMDVAESGCGYLVTLELPGVSIDDIRVEVSEQNLMVTGNRLVHCSKVASCSNDSISAFHKKEISQGPYQVVWSLPINVNKDRVSADFANGLLRITLPKLSEMSSRVIKANI